MPMPRVYSLYWRPRGERKWRRGSPLTFFRAAAIRVFQGTLLSTAFRTDIEVELRPISTKRPETIVEIPPRPEISR